MKKAAIVVAHAMLRIAYYLLTRKEMYVDLGEDYFDKQRQVSIVRHSVPRKLRLYSDNNSSLLIH
jgi:transposase